MNILKNKSFYYPLILIVLSVITIVPLFHTGFFPMHDNTQVARVYEMFTSLRDGMFPVRWVLDLGYGYGYPIFTFYAPLAYYIGAFFMFFHLDALIATKIMMMLGMVLAGYFMYLLGKDVWGEEGGFVSALFYLFAPYHALNLYVRGAVAELWGMAFVPLVFYGLWNTYKTRKWRYVVIGALGYAGVIVSHNLTALMVTPFLLLFLGGMKLNYLSKHQLLKIFLPVCVLVIGIVLATFYWLPAIGEMKYTNVLSQISGTGSKYGDHFVCLGQLWDSPWGYAGSASGCVDGISFRLGKLHIVFVLIGLLLGGFIYKKNKEKGVLIMGSIVGFVFSVYLTLQNSLWIWNTISPMSYIQFPWRFLTMAVFFASFLSGGIIWYVGSKKVEYKFILRSITFFTVILLLFLYGKLFTPQTYTQETAASLTDTKTISFVVSKISDEYMPPHFQIPSTELESVTQKVITLQGKGSILTSDIHAQKQVYGIHALTPVTVLLKTAHFPAWQTYIDDRKVNARNARNGIIITVPEGNHRVSLVYISTKLEMIGNSITLTSMVALLVGIIYLQRKKML